MCFERPHYERTTAMNQVPFIGASGRTYEYRVISSTDPATPFPGNFLFVSLNNQARIVYAGEADNVYSALSSSDLGRLYEVACTQHGATHICDHLNKSKKGREDEVRDLVRHHNPVLNV